MTLAPSDWPADPRVELIDHMGDDLAIVNAARVSYAKRSERLRRCMVCNEDLDPNGATMGSGERGDMCWPSLATGTIIHRSANVDSMLKAADKGLINYLMRERHGTPFEMVVLSFRVWCPIFVAREWQRHRIGSYNEMSSRYVEMPQIAYMPPSEDMRRQTGKPGHYVMEPLDNSEASVAHTLMRTAYGRSYETYGLLIGMGVAKEVARNVLPLAQYTEFIWTVNLRSAMNFISLRTAPTALLEIRKLADSVEALCYTVAPVAITAFGAFGRTAP